jgi:hypothetical protein
MSQVTESSTFTAAHTRVLCADLMVTILILPR